MHTLIVGGGPSGSLSAIEIGKRGYDVTLVEENSSPGFPTQCAGLISEGCFNRLLEIVKDRFLLNKITGAYLFSPDGNYLGIQGRSKAVVVERKILDSELLKRASKFAKIMVRSKFVSAKDGIAKVNESGKIKSISYDIIIGADGISSAVSRNFHFERPEIFPAVQVECQFEPIEKDMVELYFGSRYSDSFFGYAVPLNDSTARVGVVSKSDPNLYLRNILEEHPSVALRANKKKITELNVGAIPVNIIDFQKDNIALIGDSAGMVKPYTGGGIYYHLIASELLGQAFPNLAGYKEAYLNKMGIEYKIGSRILKLYSALSDSDFNGLVKMGNSEGFDFDFGNLHMDSPSTLLKTVPNLLKAFSKNPGLFAKIGKNLL